MGRVAATSHVGFTFDAAVSQQIHVKWTNNGGILAIGWFLPTGTVMGCGVSKSNQFHKHSRKGNTFKRQRSFMNLLLLLSPHSQLDFVLFTFITFVVGSAACSGHK